MTAHQIQHLVECDSLCKIHVCIWSCVVTSSKLKSSFQKRVLWDSGRKQLTSHRKFLKPTTYSQGCYSWLWKQQQLLGKRPTAMITKGDSATYWAVWIWCNEFHTWWLFRDAAVLESLVLSISDPSKLTSPPCWTWWSHCVSLLLALYLR